MQYSMRLALHESFNLLHVSTHESMKTDDRRTGTSNVMLTGAELRKIRQQDLARWKRRVHRSIEAQKYDLEHINPLDEMFQIYEAENRAYDMALKIIGARWKNV
jgi:DNA-dependent RNA polymerase auxiliary subunit epsilon